MVEHWFCSSKVMSSSLIQYNYLQYWVSGNSLDSCSENIGSSPVIAIKIGL